MKLTNALTIDVEDYFQVSAFEQSISRGKWDSLEHRVESNVDKILQILSDSGIKATFFTLSWIAERNPDLVYRIVNEGHELASHGYCHQRVTDMSPEAFRQDVLRSKKTLEDLSGLEVRGYRAPSYSIGESNTWALKILASAGYQYSSSIYPINHDHYGFPGAPRFAFRDKDSGMIEVPITTTSLLSKLIPAGGGGYFRFYPYQISRWLIRRVNVKDRQPAVFYLHPWELDPEQPRQVNIGFKTRFRHYLNLDKTEARLRQLIKDFSWGRMDEVFVDSLILPEIKLTQNHSQASVRKFDEL